MGAMMSRTPDFWLKASRTDKSNSKFVKIGAAWKNDTGTISIVLDTGTVLHWKDMDTVSVILVPSDKSGSKNKNQKADNSTHSEWEKN